MIRNEPVALLVGAGLWATLLLSLTISLVRLVRFRGVAFVHPRLPVEIEAAATTDAMIPCPLIVAARRQRRLAAGNDPGEPGDSVAGLPTASFPPGRWTLDLAAGDRTARLSAGWARHSSPPREVRGDDPGRGLYRIVRAELVVPDPFALVQVCFRARLPQPQRELQPRRARRPQAAGKVPPARHARGPAPVDALPPPVLRVLPAVGSVPASDADPTVALGERRGDLSNERNDELIEARPYHPGDDIRRINWNAFAHSGELFLRIGEETPPPAWAARLVVDTRGATGAGDLDTLLSSALGAADLLESTVGGVRVSLRTADEPEIILGGFARARRILAAADATMGLLPGYAVGVGSEEDDQPPRGAGWMSRADGAVPDAGAPEVALVCGFDTATGEVTWRPHRNGRM